MRKRNILLTIFFALLILIAFKFDNEIVSAVSSIRFELLTDILMGIIFVSSEIVIFIFLTSLFLWKEHKRRWILPLWISLAASVILSFLLKITIQRARPYQLGIVTSIEALQKAGHLIWDFSFPSFQAMLAFCALPILDKEFPKFKYVWLALASLIAFSRVYFGLHFASDVIAGALIGYLIGIGIVHLEIENGFGKNIANRVWKKK
ncbi:phosphatase PAP2 family protein [Candidatus Pacearchaeota archaeon]|nr:phosphatase PAP2 family protein [Candidatus Pacearchaeota archaeon]